MLSGFGLASHLGVVADIPTIGVGKKVRVEPTVSNSQALWEVAVRQETLHQLEASEGATLVLLHSEIGRGGAKYESE